MFKYFNPLWLIQNLLQPSINPITIGAGVGAIGSAVTGKNPIKGALLGGALGGAGQAAGLFGGAAGATEAAKQAAGSAGSAFATEGAANMGNIGMFNTFNTGAGTTIGQAGTYAQGLNPELYTGPTSMFDVGRNSTLGYDPTFLGGQGPATFAGGGGYDTSLLGSAQRGLSSGYETLADWTKANPMQALSTTGQALTSGQQEQAQQMMQPQALPVTKGIYNPSPNLGMGEGPSNKVSTKMQITPNQLQVYPNFYFRGGY